MADPARVSPCAKCDTHRRHRTEPPGVGGDGIRSGKNEIKCIHCPSRVRYANTDLGVPRKDDGVFLPHDLIDEVGSISEWSFIDCGWVTSGTENKGWR